MAAFMPSANDHGAAILAFSAYRLCLRSSRWLVFRQTVTLRERANRAKSLFFGFGVTSPDDAAASETAWPPTMLR